MQLSSMWPWERACRWPSCAPAPASAPVAPTARRPPLHPAPNRPHAGPAPPPPAADTLAAQRSLPLTIPFMAASTVELMRALNLTGAAKPDVLGCALYWFT